MACLQTGQQTCHDTAGREIACPGSGQDAEHARGIPWPTSRFTKQRKLVIDRLTGLVWMRDANPGEYPLTWPEALDYVVQINRECLLDHDDWRLPNRRELRSLLSHQTRNPALPSGHPFSNVFLGWYWSSTTAAISPAHAWYVHMEGGRMFYGGKDQSFLVWPVRGLGDGVLPATGQTTCYDETGKPVPCSGTGQDGAWQYGRAWPRPRFELAGDGVIDYLTGLYWMRSADLTGARANWREALAAIADLNKTCRPTALWRLPNINELESLIDCSAHSPALPPHHPFLRVRDGYWSSTTSMFEPDWAWALYLNKGAIGVGQKAGAHFFVWAVRDAIMD